MTENQEKDFAQMERDKASAAGARIRKQVWEDALLEADEAYLNTCKRYRDAIDQCQRVIEGVEQPTWKR